MPVCAGVARRREAEAFSLEGCAGGEAGERLERLHTRAGEDRRLDVAHRHRDSTLGREDDGGARMAGFDEATALDDGEFNGSCDGDSLRHLASLSPGRVCAL